MREVLDKKFPERRISVLAGMEEVLRRAGGVWYRKIGRCATSVFVETGQGQPCGECCKRVPENWKLGRTEEGHCVHYRGGATVDTCAVGWPFGCLTGDNAGEPYCSVKWEKVNGW